jgi:hypothetical protein
MLLKWAICDQSGSDVRCFKCVDVEMKKGKRDSTCDARPKSDEGIQDKMGVNWWLSALNFTDNLMRHRAQFSLVANMVFHHSMVNGSLSRYTGYYAQAIAIPPEKKTVWQLFFRFLPRKKMLTREPRELPDFFGHETITNRLEWSDRNGLMYFFSSWVPHGHTFGTFKRSKNCQKKK